MTSWGARTPATFPGMGAIVHGPIVLVRSESYAVGVRVVFAHPDGLEVLVAVQAKGETAAAASEASFGATRSRNLGRNPYTANPLDPILTAGIDGDEKVADLEEQSRSASDSGFWLDARYWIGKVPGKSSLQLGFSWLHAGIVAAGVTILTLAESSQVIRLL